MDEDGVTADFPLETVGATRQWSNTSNALKLKTDNLEFCTQQIYLQN